MWLILFGKTNYNGFGGEAMDYMTLKEANVGSNHTVDKLLLFFWTDSRRSKNGNRLADIQKFSKACRQKIQKRIQ